ncbi:MAG: DNA recombination protein RmuC [Actinomycetota bacterium]|nr:DNA recombination protein RmuC [Acidimicrobiales bacterium]
MDIALVIVVLLLAATVVTLVLRLSRDSVAVPVPEIKVDTTSLVTAVKEAVDAQVQSSARGALEHNAKQADALLGQRGETLKEETKNLLRPISEQMNQLKESVGQLQSSYEKEQGTVSQLRESLVEQISGLQGVTTALAGALKSPSARGAWGENQLKNIIELSGMNQHCDFNLQHTARGDQGVQRPDVTVRLPGDAYLVVDSKVPLAAYLRMQEASDAEGRDAALDEHVRAVKSHVKSLADKKYWDLFPNAPDFVVMFVPGESFLADAARHDAGLVEESMRMRVLLASPTALMALLLAASRGWQTNQLAENARAVEQEGRELHQRVGKVLSAMSKTGRSLESATKAYNEMVGSVESRVMPSMRRLAEFGISSEALPDVPAIDSSPRQMSSLELNSEDSENT